MDNDEDDFVNYNATKKKKTKRSKDVLKYSKTCAIYGIFDCICCKKEETNRVCDTVIDETINQPSTSTLANEDNSGHNSNDELLDDDIIDVGTDCVPSTSNMLSSQEFKYDKKETCDRAETNESENIKKIPEDVIEYVNTVYKEFHYENIERISKDPEINFLNELDNEIQTERSNDDLSQEHIDVAMDARPTTTSDSLSTDETTAIASIKSEVLPVTEEEEEIDVVNVPADDIQNALIDNAITTHQETTENEVKTELSDDENQIIDILNFDDTDHREDLVNNLGNTFINMESTSNANEDEIIDVENLNEGSPPAANHDQESTGLRLRRRQMKRRLRSQITINFRKRSRMLRSVMTIDLINSSRDDSIIEITDSPSASRKVTEVINVDDDDENEDPGLNTSCSPHRIGLGNCPVCLEGLAKKEIMSTICGHVYCARCIKNVIKTTKKCPNCRKNLTLKSIHPLFI